MKTMELRCTTPTLTSQDEGLVVEGIVNKPGEMSEVLFSRGKRFREVIAKGAFQKAIDNASNIDYLAEHDTKRILASTSNNSLTIEETDEGVKMTAHIVETSYGKDAYALIKSGIIGHMSFGFRALKSSWSSCDDGIPLRTVEELEIFEVSSLRNPAYVDSSISARGIEEEDIDVPEIKEKKISKIEFRDNDNKGKIEVRGKGNSVDLFFHGYIGNSSWEKWWDEDTTVPQELIAMFDDLKDKDIINVSINSGGGSVFGGVAIYNLLKKLPAKKIVHVDGLAGSIASIIMMAGDEIYVNGAVMLHKPLVQVYGNANDHRKVADTLDILENMLVNIYLTKAKEGVDEKAIKKLLNKDTWMIGSEVSEYFNVIDIQNFDEEEERGNEPVIEDEEKHEEEVVEENNEENEEDIVEEPQENEEGEKEPQDEEEEDNERKDEEEPTNDEKPQEEGLNKEDVQDELKKILEQLNASLYQIEEE